MVSNFNSGIKRPVSLPVPNVKYLKRQKTMNYKVSMIFMPMKYFKPISFIWINSIEKRSRAGMNAMSINQEWIFSLYVNSVEKTGPKYKNKYM